MKKKDIVGAALKDLLAREESLAAVSVDVRAYKRQVIATLEKKLAGVQPNLDIPTCDDFAHLGVECCSVCHIDYPEWELDLVKIELGGQAWLCCALDRALNPSKRAAMEQSPEWRKLERMLFGDGQG